MTKIKRCRNFQDFVELAAAEDAISLFAQFAIRNPLMDVCQEGVGRKRYVDVLEMMTLLSKPLQRRENLTSFRRMISDRIPAASKNIICRIRFL